MLPSIKFILSDNTDDTLRLTSFVLIMVKIGLSNIVEPMVDVSSDGYSGTFLWSSQTQTEALIFPWTSFQSDPWWS